MSTLITWKSKKQDVTSQSSREVEYRAIALTTNVIIWLCWLLADKGIYLKDYTPLHCDNKSVIHIACNSIFHDRTNNIETNCHSTGHHLQLGTIYLPFFPSAL